MHPGKAGLEAAARESGAASACAPPRIRHTVRFIQDVHPDHHRLAPRELHEPAADRARNAETPHDRSGLGRGLGPPDCDATRRTRRPRCGGVTLRLARSIT